MPSEYKVKRLAPGDADLLLVVADDVFDSEIKPHLAARFLQGKHNVLIVVFDSNLIVGMASALIYLHPDKEPELWVNELGVSVAYRRKGIAGAMMAELQSVAVAEGCSACWLLTEKDNAAANALYQSLVGWEGPIDQVMYERKMPN